MYPQKAYLQREHIFVENMLAVLTYFHSQYDNMEATMKVVSIHSLKGGTGKTMITTNLAVEAERAGHTVAIIDLDPPATATKWGDHRESESPAVVATTRQVG